MPLTTADWPFRVLLVVLAAAILFMLITYYGRSSNGASAINAAADGVIASEGLDERFYQDNDLTQDALAGPSISGPTDEESTSATAAPSAGPQPSEPTSNEDYLAVDYGTPSKSASAEAGGQVCFPKEKPLKASDLLPKDAANSKWAQANPAGQGSLSDVQLLTAGYHLGVNTVGQSLRNANLQLRSEPPNPRMNVSCWNQSTIEYDGGRRFFEVGEC
jgi:hypothetical protein